MEAVTPPLCPPARSAESSIVDGHFGNESGTWERATLVAGRYRIFGHLGQGAGGSVYRALDRTLGRPVALKLLQPGELGEAGREAQLLAQVGHRNVVKVHDHGCSDGLEFLVLELIEGERLDEWLGQRPSPSAILERFIEAGRGLVAVHAAGLSHRDFKPSNVMLAEDGRVVVIDFGLARPIDAFAGRGPQLLAEGTLAYMAPECIAGHESDARSDQFSFCVALWESLTGRNPFRGSDPLSRYRAMRSGPQGSVDGIPRHMVSALRRGMSFEPASRFASLAELLEELSRPGSTIGRSMRRPALTSLALAATFMLCWGLAPESPNIDVAQSDYDPRVDAAMVILESAARRAEDGDGDMAWTDSQLAREMLLESASPGAEAYCEFGKQLVPIGDTLVEGGSYEQGRMMYAMAIKHAEDCGESTEVLDGKKMTARNLDLLEAGVEISDVRADRPRDIRRVD